MTAVDVRALVLLLRKKLIGLRVANIYDVSGRLYLLKLSRANRKEHLLIESGIRIHTTQYVKNEKDLPSGFSMKLRKHLRTKKLDKIEQLGMDRVIDLTFGKGEAAYHILVELYASGNVILTDHEYTILSLLRSHKFEDDATISVKAKYPFSHAANMTVDSITLEPLAVKALMAEPETEAPEGAKAKKNKRDDKLTLKTVLTKMVPYASFPYAEHALRLCEADPNQKADPTDEAQVAVLIDAGNRLRQLVKEMEAMDDIKGFIIYKDDTVKSVIPEADQQMLNPFESEIIKKFEGKAVQDFVPAFLLKQHTDASIEYQSFDQCVDEYFSQAQKHREKVKLESQENAIYSKVTRIQEDQDKRIAGLQKEQDLSEYKAQLLQKYAWECQAIIDIISVMLSSGISWPQISRMIKEERKNNNPLAAIIHKINFERNSISLVLAADEEDDSIGLEVDEYLRANFAPVMQVDVDLSISAQLNVKRYFEIKKKSYSKEQKTKDAADIAIRVAEQAAAKDLAKFKQQKVSSLQRKVFWFEKFIWFISSENYLVIGGRNAQQNEALVKKYMDKTDLFMHSELHGAAVVIVKNPSGKPVPQLTLMEAATFEMCHSPCWESKVLAQVYWVTASQVSKTPPTGMFISTGSFIIRGKRSFITPQRLELGFTVMFCLGEESLADHLGERVPREDLDELEMMEAQQEVPLERQDSSVSQVSLVQGDDEDIKVVQVGEQPKQFQEQQQATKKQQKQQKQQPQKQKIENAPKFDKASDYWKSQNTGAVPRGKHNKIKKMKEKYADQDDDERQMKLALLGSKQKVQGFDIQAHSKFVQGAMYIENKPEESDEEVDEAVDAVVEEIVPATQEAEEAKEVLDEEMPELVEEGDDDDADEAEIAKLIKEEDINMLPESMDLAEIDKLTGIPKAKDQLLFCVPMLAPYSTVNTFKYKAKVQPGTLKRGRAQKQIRSLFVAQAGKVSPLELQQIKAISDQDMTMTLINSCRVLAPGLQKVQTANKQEKKKKAKQ